jgi:hypothetical protein
VNSKPNGFAIYKHIKGSKFEGTWLNFYQFGTGFEVWETDNYYEGEYMESKKNGIGIF